MPVSSHIVFQKKGPWSKLKAMIAFLFQNLLHCIRISELHHNEKCSTLYLILLLSFRRHLSLCESCFTRIFSPPSLLSTFFFSILCKPSFTLQDSGRVGHSNISLERGEYRHQYRTNEDFNVEVSGADFRYTLPTSNR